MRIALLCTFVGLTFASSSNYKCNYLQEKITGNVFPSGACYSTGVIGSGKLTCDPTKPNEVKLLTSSQSDCPAGSTETTLTLNTPIISLWDGYCGGADCYTTFSAYGSNDCTGTAFSAGIYAGGEQCQNRIVKYYCDTRGFYMYLHTIPGCYINWARIVIHQTGCQQTVNLKQYGVPQYINSFQFGACQSANPPPGSFQLQLNYHSQALCTAGSEILAFEFPLLQLGCLAGKYEYFCASDGFYKYEYAGPASVGGNCTGNVVEVAHLPNRCLVDFTETLVTGLNFGSVSFQCLAGGPSPRPIAFGAQVEASNIKIYADSTCSTQEIRQVYAVTGACRPMTELETSNVFPTTATAVVASRYYKITCTATGFEIDARYPNNRCSGVAPERKNGTLGACVSVVSSSGAGVVYMTVLQCQTNLQVATPQPVGATSVGFVPRALFVWGFALVGVVLLV